VGYSNGLVIQYGVVTITPVANTPTSVWVTFPLTFAANPNIQVTANTAAPGQNVIEVSFNSPSTSGTNITIYRNATTSTSVVWLAIGFKNW